MSAPLNLAAIAEARQRAIATGLARPPRPLPRGRPPRAPDVRFCTFDPAAGEFRVFFDDFSAVQLPLSALDGVGSASVVAWSVDAARTGVDVVLSDGKLTNFSAGFAKYVGDPSFRSAVEQAQPASGALAQTVASNVRALREGRGWSVTDLARAADMNPPNVHRVESARHNPTTATLTRLANALGVSVLRLLRAPTDGTRAR